ncbi:hypothetical protein ABK040_014105 [Willaertia magna]
MNSNSEESNPSNNETLKQRYLHIFPWANEKIINLLTSDRYKLYFKLYEPSLPTTLAYTFIPLFMRHPLERVVTILQVQHVSPYQMVSSKTSSEVIPKVKKTFRYSTMSSAEIMVSATEGKLFTNAFQVFSSIFKDQGFLSCWRGVIPSCIHHALTRVSDTATVMYTNIYAKEFVASLINDETKSKEEKTKLLHRLQIYSLLFSSITLASTNFVFYPLLLAQIHLEADIQRKRSFKLTGLFKAIKLTEGISGFYRGVSLNIASLFARNITFFIAADYFPVKHQHIEGFLSELCFLTAGAAISYPLELVRNRMILQVGLGHKEKLFGNVSQAFAFSLQREGMRGLYRGFNFYLLNYFIINHLILYAYNTFKSALPFKT